MVRQVNGGRLLRDQGKVDALRERREQKMALHHVARLGP